VSSRQEEKQRRREERLAREQAEKAAAARRQRLQIAGGVVAGVAVVAVAVLLIAGVIGGSSSGDERSDPTATEDIKLPEQKTNDLNAAAKAAGCTLKNPPIEGRNHEQKNFKASDYKTNPPTSGNHNPKWYQDGEYSPGNTPRLGELVHPLEHGRIELQYRKGTPARTVKQLESLFKEFDDGYHMLLFENTTNMRYAVAATAWGHSLTCPTMNDKVFDAIRAFRTAYINKGPEVVP
jgi:hypothetical protein